MHRSRPWAAPLSSRWGGTGRGGSPSSTCSMIPPQAPFLPGRARFEPRLLLFKNWLSFIYSRGSQRDVVYRGRQIAPSYMSPNAGEGLRGLSQWVQLCAWNPILPMNYRNIVSCTVFISHHQSHRVPMQLTTLAIVLLSQNLVFYDGDTLSIVVPEPLVFFLWLKYPLYCMLKAFDFLWLNICKLILL